MLLLARVTFWMSLLLQGLATDAVQDAGIGNGMVDGNYIGGYFKYDPATYTVYKYNIGKPTVTVTTLAALKDALAGAKRGDIIYVDDKAVLDVSDTPPLVIRDGVTVCSGRGINKSQGALFFSNNLSTAPVFKIAGANIRLAGLRIKGPDSTIVNTSALGKARQVFLAKNPGKAIDTTNFKVFGIPNSDGIQVYGKNAVIENCEVSGFSHAGIFIRSGSTAAVHHNYVHHNQRYGLGYGICVEKSFATITGNLFDYNRHAIAGTGEPGTSYVAKYNVALPHSTLQSHIFDMHGGGDRKDGTNIAGDSVVICNNLFYVQVSPAIRVRGVPIYTSSIYNNDFVLVKGGDNRPQVRSAAVQATAQTAARKAPLKQEQEVEQYYKKTLKIFNNNVLQDN